MRLSDADLSENLDAKSMKCCVSSAVPCAPSLNASPMEKRNREILPRMSSQLTMGWINSLCKMHPIGSSQRKNRVRSNHLNLRPVESPHTWLRKPCSLLYCQGQLSDASVHCLASHLCGNSRPTSQAQLGVVVEEERLWGNRAVRVDPLGVDLAVTRPAGIGRSDVEDRGFAKPVARGRVPVGDRCRSGGCRCCEAEKGPTLETARRELAVYDAHWFHRR
jgi:hypothetical protein